MNPPIVVTAISDMRVIAAPEFIAQWDALADRCPWATCFQGSTFVTVWYETYRPTHAPFLVCGWRGEHLEGLLPLAIGSQDGEPVIAGSYHAEYQAWLADPADNGAFVGAALQHVCERFPRSDLAFRYLPRHIPREHLAMAGRAARLTVVMHRRPLMRIDADALAKSLAKKSNKSRLNRLKRLGNLTLDRLTTEDDLNNVIDDVIWQYDLRQGAINRSTPFLEDTLKRPFHLALMSRVNALHATVLRIDDTIVSAHVDYLDRKWSYLGVPSHSPFYFQHSPGKLHMLLLGKRLADEGIECLDLTPGGDPWKERFANDHDEVSEAIIHRNALGRIWDRLPVTVRTGLRKAISSVGVDPRVLKAKLERVRGLRSRLGNGVYAGRSHSRASLYRLGKFDGEDRPVSGQDNLLASVNRPRDLMCWMRDETLAGKHALLSMALDRLERGNHLVTCVNSDQDLVGVGWVVKGPANARLDHESLQQVPNDGVLLYGVLTPELDETTAVTQALLRVMLQDARALLQDGLLFALFEPQVVVAARAMGVAVIEDSSIAEPGSHPSATDGG